MIVQKPEPQIASVVGEVKDDALLLEVEQEALQSDRIMQEYSETTFQIYPEPCDDFYDHVCSVWQKAAAEATKASGQLPGASVSTDTRLQGDMEARLLSYVADPKHTNVAPARRLYESCLDRPSTQLAPQQASEQFRKWRIGSWPRTDGGSPTDVWVFAAELMRDLGVEAFLGVALGLDPRTLDKAIVELGPPKPLFFASDISQQQVLSIFSSAARESATQLWPGNVAPANKAAEDVKVVLGALAALRLNDKGDSPDDYELMAFNSMGTGLREFLQTIFANLNNLDPTTQILTRHGRVVPRELEETVSNLPARAVLNYLGLRALLPLAPFLPDIVPLQLLHAIDVLGRPELANASVMCLRATGQALPACLAAALRSTMVTEEPKRQVWLNQLEALFLDAVKKVIWLDELSTLLVRYKMRHHRLARFSPLQGVCRQPQGAVAASPLAAFIQISKLQQRGELQQISHFPLPPTAGSPLDVWPTYKLSQQLMHIPAGLVNASVPSNSTFFALHLSRLGTRFFAALSKLLYDSTVYELETPLRFTPDAQAALDRLLDCIVQDARPLFGHHQDPSHLRLALLEQVLAIQLAFLAFRQLLGTRRIWKRDFRLAPLPDVSSDKLFFIYYALDHCELSDDLFSRHEVEAHRRLPAKQRVNVALRQSPAFARAFSCQAGAPMTATSLCQVLR
ncbi:hypothetical protein IscW_ISCW006879 [Ixodes scapularis]|uniref:Uncharacterized protein n=1 Tax=Ixodes scapularis TaxID=6945 RepID=B7PNT4_IXOSC|nr:hypothetical protein IscW_ISCW006879 [Ixodes scapularis]|eukprot:XP_002435426.1 hypothetical protein IscW_ISCW006879 [Ixodes scapularis]